VRLTKRQIDAAAYPGKGNARHVIWDDDPKGLGLRVYPSGRKAFVVYYRDAGGADRLATIGDYGVFTLDQARDAARGMLRQAESGADAMKVRRAHKAAPTFGDLARDYEAKHAPTKKTGAEDVRRITKHLLHWKARKLDGITRDDVRDLANKIKNSPREVPKRKGKGPGKIKSPGALAKAGSPVKPKKPHSPKAYEANRTVALLSKMFALAELWALVPAGHPNPCKGVPKAKEVKRDRWVEPTELPKLAAAIDAEANPYARAALWLYLLTGCRKSELLGARWEDVKEDRKVLRLAETKNGKPHEIPLAPAALAMIAAIPKQEGNPYLFPSPRLEKRPMEDIRTAWNRVRVAACVEDVRLHDLRRTVGSWLAQSGNTLHLIGRVLNHSNTSTTAVYARFAQDNVRDAMEAHAANLLGAAGKLSSAEIHDLDAARKAKVAK
jgi:integrase